MHPCNNNINTNDSNSINNNNNNNNNNYNNVQAFGLTVFFLSYTFSIELTTIHAFEVIEFKVPEEA